MQTQQPLAVNPPAFAPADPGKRIVAYLIDIGPNLDEVEVLLDIANPRAFMFEMDPSPSIGALVANRLHPAGVRAFTYDASPVASVDELRGLYDDGFDVVSAQAAQNGVTARIDVNRARGITPP